MKYTKLFFNPAYDTEYALCILIIFIKVLNLVELFTLRKIAAIPW